jgi:acylglycerol lipase
MTPTSETVPIGGNSIGWHVWQHKSSTTSPGPLVIVYHGFLAHGRYPTVRYAAELCASQLEGATVVAPDMPGHGDSDGPPGYLPSATALITSFGQGVLQTARDRFGASRPILLVGSSMGGTIALQVALREAAGAVAGVVLLAPMLKLSVSDLEWNLLSGLAALIPTWQVIPSSSTSADKQHRDPVKREECESDAHAVKGGKIRVASALTCVTLAKTAVQGVDDDDATKWSNFPLWIGVADEDVVVDKEGSFDLHKMVQAAGGSSTMSVYPALHGLLCEPLPLYDQITKDMIAWMKERV